MKNKSSPHYIFTSASPEVADKQSYRTLTNGQNHGQIQSFINSLSKDGANERNGKPLSAKSIRHNLILISDVFGYAVKMGVVAENPCSKVTLPKIEQNEKKIYTPEHAARFLDLLDDEPIKYRAFFNLAVYSGFRRGEMLEWKDIDFDNGIISVRRTSNQTKARGVYRYNQNQNITKNSEIFKIHNGLTQGTAGLSGQRGTQMGQQVGGNGQALYKGQWRTPAPEHYIHLVKAVLQEE